MSTPLLDELKEDINERQDELFSIQIALEDEARKASNFAKYLRIAVIFLGAFAATRVAVWIGMRAPKLKPAILTIGRPAESVTSFTLPMRNVLKVGVIPAVAEAGDAISGPPIQFRLR